VGEWARAWPLEYVFKSFGAYFIRRRFREPLYHTVLERYVQLITRNGVTQGIFPEGGLSRDGKLRAPKLGLLDYICRTLTDPAFDRDIWLVPVALNYDRVLEDRSLIRELIAAGDRPSRLAQLGTVVSYLASNTVRLLTGRLKRYGRVAVNFGTPQSLRAWLETAPANVLALPKEQRLAELDRLGREMLSRIGAIIPVTPVPLAAAALLSFGQTVIKKDDLLERMDQLRDRLQEVNGKVVRGGARIAEVWDRAWRMLRMRRLVIVDGGLGQLHAAAEALAALGITYQPLASIAKREEWIYVYGQEDEPIILDKFSPILHLVQTIRDEAHRFAVTFHRTRRNAERLTSELHEVPGVGAKTVEKLLRTFGSLDRVRQASPKELIQVVGAAATKRLSVYFASDNKLDLVQLKTVEEPEPEYRPEPVRPPIVMEEATPRAMAASHTEGVAVDTLRDAMIANFEKEDLDVPAFLRKRTEIS